MICEDDFLDGLGGHVWAFLARIVVGRIVVESTHLFCL